MFPPIRISNKIDKFTTFFLVISDKIGSDRYSISKILILEFIFY